MKLFILFWFFAFGTQLVIAQVVTQKKSIEKKTSTSESPTLEPLKTRPEISLLELEERLPSADRYILDIKSLMNYFLDKKIPADFPMYRRDKSFAYNRRKALKWFRNHENLITEERKTWLKLN